MDTNTIVTLIGSLGFPIVSAVYLMTTMNKTLSELRDSMIHNNAVMEDLKDMLKESEKDAK